MCSQMSIMPPNSNSMKKIVLGLRLVELDSPYIIIGENVGPKLCEYITRLENVKFVDNLYHTYCGEIKEVLDDFLNYWTDVMDRTLKEAYKLEYLTPLKKTKDYLEDVIKTHLDQQVYFGKLYLPAENSEEEKAYKTVEEKFEPFMEFLYKLQKTLINFDPRDCLRDLMKGHVEASLQKKKDLFEFARVVIAKFLATKLYEFRVSMEEVQLRIRGNLKQIEDGRDATHRRLLHELYDGNKNKLSISRNDHTNTNDLAEMDFSIKKIHDKIKELETHFPTKHLTEELAYWDNRLAEFHKIEDVLKKLKQEDEVLQKYEKYFENGQFDEFSVVIKECCVHNMKRQVKERRKFIDEKTLDAKKGLITFFAVRGYNRVIYNNRVGKYTVDAYGHRVYLFDHGSFKPHMDCYGEYKQVNENEQKYLYDDFGRYVIENGEKLYQCAPCTSTYKLRDGNLLVKATKDCGHSEKKSPGCKMEIKNPNYIELLPSVDPVDIKGTLKEEEVVYLWNALGGILTKSLNAVGLKRSNNPIQHLAHELLRNKYRTTTKEVQQSKQDAEEYRSKILNDRHQKALKSYTDWKSMQMKRKSQTPDETREMEIYDTKMAEYQLICDINEANEN